ncbi:MAG: sugar phosphate isomerase/epimerase [Victivallaceae bacterium]|nr:sugar phosphate isomerase/epimerase [Victivallaceae bacterium]
MKLGINGATTLKYDLITDIESANKAGFRYLEISSAKLQDFLSGNSFEKLRELFKDNEITPASINTYEGGTLFRNEKEKNALKKGFREFCAVTSKINCKYAVVIPSFLPEDYMISEEEIHQQTVAILKEYSDIALEYNVCIGFEFLGFKNCSVNNLKNASKIVRETAKENVGMVLDVFHFYIAGSEWAALDNLDMEKLFIVHINDCENLPLNELKDYNRLLPGKGVIPLNKILSILCRMKYQGLVSVEIFRPEYWEWPPEKIMNTARETAMAILKGADCRICI